MGVLSAWLTPAVELPLGLAALILFIALLTFRESGSWSLLLLLPLALCVGTLLGLLWESGPASGWGMVISLWLGAQVVGAACGVGLRGRCRWLSGMLWALACVYLVGWFVLRSLNMPRGVMVGWAAGGVAVFIGLFGSWFSSFANRLDRFGDVSLAADLYILDMNLGLGVWMLVQTLRL
jgi:hypothetical protein